jgi:hypothetical protein
MRNLLALLVVVIWPFIAASADPDPREFYNRNFAAVPEVAQKPLAGEVVGSKRNPASSNASAHTASEDERSNPPTGGSGLAAPGTAGPTKRRSVFPSTMLSVYVNSKDSEHLKRVLEKALAVAKRDHAYLTNVYHIGDYRNVPADLARKIREAGVHMYPLSAIPSDFPISQSPAWIFHGKDGYRIVEGTLDIEQFYDSSGSFKEPQNFTDTSNAQPTPVPSKLAGF